MRGTGGAVKEAEPNQPQQATPSSDSVAAAAYSVVAFGPDSETGTVEARSQRHYTPENSKASLHNFLRPLAAAETPEQRTSRKRKLLCLLQSHDTAQLNALAQQAQAPTLRQLLNSQKRAPVLSLKTSNRPSDLPSALALCPHPSTKRTRKPRRSSYRAKTLRELEAETLSYHLPAVGYNRHLGTQDLRPFSLRFQECSILAIARYTSRRTNAPQRSIPNLPPRACVDVNFRRCGICRKWGHYESECSHIQRLEADRALHIDQREVRKIARTAAAVAAAAGGGGSPEVQNDVCVELCDGFMIEQRKDPRNETSNKEENNTPPSETVVEGGFGGFKIKASTTSFEGPNTAISVGDLVAWNTDDDRIATGAVETIDHLHDSVTVRSIAISSSNTSDSFSEPPNELQRVQISLPITSVKRVKRARSLEVRRPTTIDGTDKKKQGRQVRQDGTWDPKRAPAFVGGIYRKPEGREPKGMEWDEIRGLWKPGKERRKLNEDGTLNCTKPPVLVDGVYRKPRGRDPKGMEWDEIRGLWKPSSHAGGRGHRDDSIDYSY